MALISLCLIDLAFTTRLSSLLILCFPSLSLSQVFSLQATWERRANASAQWQLAQAGASSPAVRPELGSANRPGHHQQQQQEQEQE